MRDGSRGDASFVTSTSTARHNVQGAANNRRDYATTAKGSAASAVSTDADRGECNTTRGRMHVRERSTPSLSPFYAKNLDLVAPLNHVDLLQHNHFTVLFKENEKPRKFHEFSSDLKVADTRPGRHPSPETKPSLAS